MRERVSLGLVLVFLLAVNALAQEAAQKEQGRLKGTWSVVSIETPDGQKVPVETIRNSRIEFTADKMILKEGNRTKEAAYRADVLKSPHHIDLTPADGPDKGKTLAGIFVIEGDRLKICLSEPGKERPDALASREKTRSGLMVLQRTKP